MKILIIGNIASGKSTLARKLGSFFNIPVFSIDQIVHDDTRCEKRSLSNQIKLINQINHENKNWIIEGVLRKDLDVLLTLASDIIFLDFGKKIRKRRILLRFMKQKLHLEKTDYKPTISMLKQLYEWNNSFDYSLLRKRLEKYYNKLIILKNKNDIKKLFLAYEKIL